MKKILALVLVILSVTLFAEVQTSIPLTKESTNYNINTVDTNSIYTRSDTYEFEKVNVSEIAPLIYKTLSEYGTISINETLNMIVINEQKSKLQNIMALCKKLDIDKMDEYKKLLTERIPLSFTQPSDLIDYLTSSLSLDGFIQADDDYNVLIVHDHDSKIELIKNEIKKYDLPPKEVKLKLEIFELSSDGLSDVGIDIDNAIQNINVDLVKFDLKEFDKTKMYHDYGFGNDVETSYHKISNVNDDFRSDLGLHLRLSDLLRFMQQNESVKTISSPSVTAINNTIANLFVQNNLSLSIKPLIGNSEFIKLEIDCEIFESNNNQHITNEVFIKNGDPFILGEMSKTRTIKIQKKVPLLGTILPFLFSREVESEERVKIVMFLTPEIIELEDYTKQSADIKQQLIPKE
jgi:type II secretory pathway component GspD/PulD (secretin)